MVVAAISMITVLVGTVADTDFASSVAVVGKSSSRITESSTSGEVATCA